MTRYIHITGWDRFQHYKDRRPNWIKVHPEILGNPRWMKLPPATRLVLLGLWLMYAESGREIPEDTAWLTRRLNVRVTKQQLESLNHAGFIHFSASKMLAFARSRENINHKPQNQKQNASVDEATDHHGARARLIDIKTGEILNQEVTWARQNR